MPHLTQSKLWSNRQVNAEPNLKGFKAIKKVYPFVSVCEHFIVSKSYTLILLSSPPVLN